MRFQAKLFRQSRQRSLILPSASARAYGIALISLAICVATSLQAGAQAQAAPSNTTVTVAALKPETMPANPPSIALTALPAETAADQQIAQDRARLLQLANDLKVEVDKSTPDTLSIGVIRKAAEIQRIARDLKDKMKSSSKTN